MPSEKGRSIAGRFSLLWQPLAPPAVDAPIFPPVVFAGLQDLRNLPAAIRRQDLPQHPLLGGPKAGMGDKV